MIQMMLYRRASQGLDGLQAPDSGKIIIFRAKSIFRTEASNQRWKMCFFLYILNEKNGIYFVYPDIKCPKSGISTINNYWVGWVGQSNFGIAVFSSDVEKFFGQRWLSPAPRKKLARVPMCSASWPKIAGKVNVGCGEGCPLPTGSCPWG